MAHYVPRTTRCRLSVLPYITNILETFISARSNDHRFVARLPECLELVWDTLAVQCSTALARATGALSQPNAANAINSVRINADTYVRMSSIICMSRFKNKNQPAVSE